MPEPTAIALILGGARSGKSAFAQKLAQQSGGPVVFVATARTDDPEMIARVAAHRAARPSGWRTVEAPRGVGDAILAEGPGARTILLDCLTLLISNCLTDPYEDCQQGAVGDGSDEARALWAEEEVRSLLVACKSVGANLVAVSGEVGSGIVPSYPLGRVFRDILGQVNQTVADAADAVFLMVAGIPIDVKQLPTSQMSWPLKNSG